MNEQQLAESQRGQKNSKDDEPMDPPQITIKPEVETRFEQLSIERKIKKNDDEIHRSDKIQEEQRLSGEVDLAQEQEQESDYAMHGGTANNTGEHAQVHPEHAHAPCPQSNYPSRCRERHRTGSEHAINCVVLQSPFASPFTVPLSIATSTGMAAVMNGRNGRIPYTTIFAGVSFKLFSSYAMIAIAYHDSSFNIDWMMQHVDLSTCEELTATIVEWLRAYSVAHKYKIVGVGIDRRAIDPVEGGCELLPHQLWIELDSIPFILDLTAGELDERADSASRKCASYFGVTVLPHVTIGYRNEVLVDCDGAIHLAQLRDYRETVPETTWSALMREAQLIRSRRLNIVYFNSTPQGGGVALMRHSLMRLYKLLGINATWFVPKPNPSVFRITKDWHNILQGVAGPDVRFDEHCKEQYEAWVALNCERYWVDGPFRTADVIVLDDPQTVGLVPFIKRVNHRCKIIYRSHIEIRSELADDPETVQHHVWSYLWQFIKHADVFVAHPIKNFIPSCVPLEKVVLMSASTDPLDGLNKPVSDELTHYYVQQFNRTCVDQMGNRLLSPHRPYIIQIARFDPSKGIDDVLEAYRLLRERMDTRFALRAVPQLVICGHGSVDDPDATVVYNHVMDVLASDEFVTVRNDVCVVRLPPSDQLLNALMRGASVALQLSHREGFEVKVTEALHKNVPIIAYRAGGIPLQIVDGHGGFLIEVGDTQAVADKLFELMDQREMRDCMAAEAKSNVTDEYFSVFQIVNWLSIFREVTEEKPSALWRSFDQCKCPEGCRWAKHLWQSQQQANGDRTEE